MAHVPAEACLGILELLADGAREMPLGEIAERLACRRAARTGC
jgi:DNA-binding IclR family transcriptional regulator